jgi:hypothetical protein
MNGRDPKAWVKNRLERFRYRYKPEGLQESVPRLEHLPKAPRGAGARKSWENGAKRAGDPPMIASISEKPYRAARMTD